jgi:hypothetical protein
MAAMMDYMDFDHIDGMDHMDIDGMDHMDSMVCMAG